MDQRGRRDQRRVQDVLQVGMIYLDIELQCVRETEPRIKPEDTEKNKEKFHSRPCRGRRIECLIIKKIGGVDLYRQTSILNYIATKCLLEFKSQRELISPKLSSRHIKGCRLMVSGCLAAAKISSFIVGSTDDYCLILFPYGSVVNTEEERSV